MEDGLHGYRKNFGTYMGRVAVHVVPAIVLGVVVDKACEYIQKRMNIGATIMIIIQIVIMVIVLFILERYVSVSYSDEWQSNTPGLFFVSFYFGTQFNIFANIASLTKKIQGQ